MGEIGLPWQKDFFTSQFYHSIRCFLWWKFLTDDVDCRASANFMVPTFFRAGRFTIHLIIVTRWLCRDTDTSFRIKNPDPAPDSADKPVFQHWYVPFSGNYLSWNRTWYPHTTSLKIKNRIVGKTKKTQTPPTTPILRRDRMGGQQRASGCLSHPPAT